MDLEVAFIQHSCAASRRDGVGSGTLNLYVVRTIALWGGGSRKYTLAVVVR